MDFRQNGDNSATKSKVDNFVDRVDFRLFVASRLCIGPKVLPVDRDRDVVENVIILFIL